MGSGNQRYWEVRCQPRAGTLGCSPPPPLSISEARCPSRSIGSAFPPTLESLLSLHPPSSALVQTLDICLLVMATISSFLYIPRLHLFKPILFLKKITYLFIFVCAGSLLHYSLVVVSGFSLWWFLLFQSRALGHVGFRSCGSPALEHRFSCCGSWA